MYPRFYKQPQTKSFFLFGPRGTGKTTWIKNLLPNADYLDLLDAETARQLLTSPSRLTGLVSAKPTWIVLDEVQKVPAVLDEVHRLIESKRWKFVLTGSSARKLRRGGANLLAGRALQYFFHPLTIWELGKDFDLKRALQFGMLPAVWGNESPKEFLSSYVYTYLKEEVLAEGLTRNLQAFSRFLEVVSFSQAQPIKLTAIASDVGVDAKVISNYLEVLEDLLLAVRLPIFKRRAKRRLTAHPKFLYFDVGVYRSLRPRGPLDSEAEIDGASLETLFFQHLRALGEFCRWDQELCFWRSQSAAEIDFVSYGPLGLFAFEIKRSSMVREEDLRSLRIFQTDYPMAKCFLFYLGTKSYRQDHIDIISFEQGLKQLPELFGVSLP